MENKWISVKDRLPDHYIRVLTFNKDSKSVEIAQYREAALSWIYNKEIGEAEYTILNAWFVDDNCMVNEDDVTHWMPLPDLPKE